MPEFLDGNHLGMALAELILSGLILVVNQKFFISGAKGLIHRSPNMDTLVAMGSGVSYVWSIAVMFMMTCTHDMSRQHELMMGLYFESAAMILTLITVGKLLEARAKGRTTDALKSLMKLSPDEATVEREGKELKIAANEVKVGDIFLLRPGESVPVDGEVVSGSSSVNEAALTGESIPVDKAEGDSVSAATINQNGFLRCRATRVGEDTTLSKIIKLVSDAAATKAPIAKIADRVSGVFVPAVIAIAAVTLIIWLAVGQTAGYALARAISVLVISCPCALGLATPVAIMVGSGVGAKNGLLFKTAVSLEQTGKVQIVALDKTGTVTMGEPGVTDVIPADGVSEEELLSCAYSLERLSEHPLAGAVTVYCGEKKVPFSQAENFRAVTGSGLTAVIDGEEAWGGSFEFIKTIAPPSRELTAQAERLAGEGKTPLMFSKGGRLLGMIAAADKLKPESPEAIKQLREMGVQVVMLTGDNQRTADAIGKQAGVDKVIAGVMPDEKAGIIKELKKQGLTTMVGDGINDAPALTEADIGIAIGAGADAAIDAGSVVLMKSRLTDVSAAVRLSRRVLRNIKENLFWAFIYNVIGIPLAAGAYIKLFGLELDPMFGAAAMSLSSFCVVTNALRLNLVKPHDPSRDKRSKNALDAVDLPERKRRTMTVRIEGMMCHHCEAAVKKALEALPQISSVTADYEKGTAVLELNAPIEDTEPIRKAVEAEDYEFVGVEG